MSKPICGVSTPKVLENIIVTTPEIQLQSIALFDVLSGKRMPKNLENFHTLRNLVDQALMHYLDNQ